MALGQTGGYSLWVSNLYASGGYYPSATAESLIVFDGVSAHVPTGYTATAGSLAWNGDPYGTFAYWIIAWDNTTGAFVNSSGPSSADALWQYTLWVDQATWGTANLTVPAGDYWFLLYPMAWDLVWDPAIQAGAFGTVQ